LTPAKERKGFDVIKSLAFEIVFITIAAWKNQG
jgi:hypothetical protein